MVSTSRLSLTKDEGKGSRTQDFGEHDLTKSHKSFSETGSKSEKVTPL